MTEAQSRLERHRTDLDYYETHYRELLAQYSDQWIAISGRRVVGSADDAFELTSKLKGMGIPPSRVLRRHMTQEAELLILSNQ